MVDDSFRNRLILVVDDEERIVRFVRLNLEHDGFRVVGLPGDASVGQGTYRDA